MRSELSWTQIEFKFSDLFFQNSISADGSGWLPFLSEFSGSCFSTFLICFCQWMMAAAWLRYQLTFKDMGFIFGGGALTVGCVRGRKRQQGTAFDLANGHVGVGEEGVELVH